MNFDTEPIDPVILQKLKHNSFGGSNDDEFLIGDQISKFNHSCNPNAISIIADKAEWQGITIHYVAVYAIKPILVGEEILISYKKDVGHGPSVWNFNCPCNLTPEKRQQIWNINDQLGIKLRNEYSLNISKLLMPYETSEKFKNIIKNTYLFMLCDKQFLLADFFRTDD